jgi:hypothetical protein
MTNTSTTIKALEMLKAWIPVIITVGGLVVGYFVFKAETQHQFEMQASQIAALKGEIQYLRGRIEDEQRTWQREIETKLQTLREQNIRQDLKIEAIEGRR